MMDRWLGNIALGMAALAGMSIATLMGFTFFDIVSRPLGVPGYRGIIEISYLSIICAAFFGLPLVCIRKEHIVVDLATHQLSDTLNSRIDGFWIVCIAVFLLVQGYFVGLTGIEEHIDGDRSEAMQWTPLLFAVPAVFGCAAAGVFGFIYAFRKNSRVEEMNIGNE